MFRPALLARRYQFHGGQAASLAGFLAALANDELSARLAASDWSHYLAAVTATLVSVVNPERIVLAARRRRSLPIPGRGSGQHPRPSSAGREGHADRSVDHGRRGRPPSAPP